MIIPQDVLFAVRDIAATVSPPLLDEINRIGPIEIVASRHSTVADQLYVEVINQQLSAKAADAILARLMGAANAQGGKLADLFVPEHDATVRACGVSRNKVKALQAIRCADALEHLNRAELAAMAHEQRVERLCSIWGIGRWTADMVGIFHFLDQDIWPEGDVAVTGALRRITGCVETSTLARQFAPYRSILARYMWRSRDTAGSDVLETDRSI